MKQRIYLILPQLVLVLIGLVLAFQNYTPHTYLSGWDTLHPEFNFSEYFKRVIFGVWQDHQGLGAVASQAHPSELPRLIIYYLSSFIIPKDFLRYAYIFACLIIGPLGIYQFLKKLGKIPAFLSSLFYMLNLITVQQFFVPFEMFATHYATLPWIFYFAIEYLAKRDKKNLIFFSLVTLLSTSIAHTATLWYAFFFAFLVFLLVCNLIDKRAEVRKASINLILATLIINLFWLLPNFYFILTHSKEVANSKIHTLFTEEAFAQNASFGNIKDLALSKNFLFNWGQYVGNDKFEPLLSAWTKHLDNPLISLLGFLFFGITISGICNSFRLKSKIRFPIFTIFILSVFFLLNINPPFGFIFRFLQDHFPLFKEAIRFPFTKFSIIFLFASTFFFAFGVLLLEEFGKKYLKNASIIVLLLLTFFIFVYGFPAFEGNLIDPLMRVSIPKEYFDLFKWFDREPDGRIASFPMQSFWGWDYYNFDGQGKNNIYQGAGFLWFGIKQPILLREFDRWNTLNEEYYREMSQAVYTKDENLFRSVLTKYNISYIFVDKNIVAPGSSPQVLFFNEIDKMLSDLGFKSSFNSEKLSVYKIPSNDTVYTLKGEKNVSPSLNAGYEDFAFENYGPYLNDKSRDQTVFPLRNLIDNENRVNSKLLKLTQQGILVSLGGNKISQLSIPKFEDYEGSFAVDLIVERRKNSLDITFSPKFPKSNVPLITSAALPQDQNNFLLSINQKDNFILNNISFNTPLSLGTVFLNTKGSNSISIYQDKDDLSLSPKLSSTNFSLNPCEAPSSGTFEANTNFNNLKITAKTANPCLDIPLSNIFPDVPASSEYLLGVSFTSKNSQDSSFCLSQDGVCKDYELKNIYTLPFSSDKFNSYFGLKGDSMGSTNLRFSLNANSSTKPETASFSDLNLNLKRPFYHLDFSSDILNLSLDNLRKSNDTSFIIPFSGQSELSKDITIQNKPKGDCLTNPGLISEPKREIVRKEFKDYIRYKASDGSFCDHFSYRNLNPYQAYLIIVQSRNIEGLPIRLCVTNLDTKRCDIYTHLSSSKQFVNDIFLLPPTKNSSGFDININNFAIKNIPAVNDIASITVIPFPYNFLSRIQLNPQGSNPSTQTVEFSKENKSLYEAKVHSPKQGEVLALSQAYEGGWHAYQNGKDLEHVMVNNWANGFILSDSNRTENITIIFLPQILEYFGLLVLIVSVLIFLLKDRFRLDFRSYHML